MIILLQILASIRSSDDKQILFAICENIKENHDDSTFIEDELNWLSDNFGVDLTESQTSRFIDLCKRGNHLSCFHLDKLKNSSES